jgi:hypothetical protein
MDEAEFRSEHGKSIVLDKGPNSNTDHGSIEQGLEADSGIS